MTPNSNWPHREGSIVRATLVSCALFILMLPQAGAASPAQRALIVVSNVADMGDPERHEAENTLCEIAPPGPNPDGHFQPKIHSC